MYPGSGRKLARTGMRNKLFSLHGLIMNYLKYINLPTIFIMFLEKHYKYGDIRHFWQGKFRSNDLVQTISNIKLVSTKMKKIINECDEQQTRVFREVSMTIFLLNEVLELLLNRYIIDIFASENSREKRSDRMIMRKNLKMTKLVNGDNLFNKHIK